MIRRPERARAARRPFRRPVAALATVVAAGVPLAGCTTTQERSATLSSQAEKAAETKKFSVGRTNRDVKVSRVTRLASEDVAAVVVRIDNGTGKAQTLVPIGLDLYDAEKVSLYTNRVDGLDQALNTVPVAPPGVSYWVNNQVPVTKPARTRVRLGQPRIATPADLPEMAVSRLEVGDDAGIATLRGVVRNRSAVPQLRLTVFAVATKGSEVVAAGRAVVDRLDAGKGKRFSIYFTGDPRGAKLHVDAPPSTLAGA